LLTARQRDFGILDKLIPSSCSESSKKHSGVHKAPENESHSFLGQFFKCGAAEERKKSLLLTVDVGPELLVISLFQSI
jgi:hypothetical protein